MQGVLPAFNPMHGSAWECSSCARGCKTISPLRHRGKWALEWRDQQRHKNGPKATPLAKMSRLRTHDCVEDVPNILG